MRYSSSEFCWLPPKLAMPWQRFTVMPFFTVSKVASRVSFTQRAISAAASSQAMGSHSEAPGRRTIGLVLRFGFFTTSRVSGSTMLRSWNIVAPFGQSPPSLMGWSGSPSRFTSSPSRTEQMVPHPPEQ